MKTIIKIWKLGIYKTNDEILFVKLGGVNKTTYAWGFKYK